MRLPPSQSDLTLAPKIVSPNTTMSVWGLHHMNWRQNSSHCRSWEKNYYTWDFQIMLEAWRKLNLCSPMTLTESSYFTFTNVLSLWSSLHPMFLVVCTQFSCTVEFPGSLCFCFLIILLIHCLLLWGSFHFILLHWISAKKMPSWELQIFCNNLQLWFKGILQLTNEFLVFHLFFLTTFDLAVSLPFSYWP